MTHLSLFKSQCQRELLILLRQTKLIVNSYLYFLMIIVFFPMAFPLDPTLLKQTGGALVWLGLLMIALGSADRLFLQDYNDGIIEQYLIADKPLHIIVNAKVLINWLINLIPLLLFSPIYALLFDLSAYEVLILDISLFAGSIVLFYLCAFAASAALCLSERGVFMGLIVLPLTLPVLIFGSGSLRMAIIGAEVGGFIALNLAFACIAIALLPYAIALMMQNSIKGADF